MNHILPGAADFLKKGEVGKVVYIKPHLWDLQPGGDSFGGESIPDLLQAVMKIVVQAPGFQAIACSFLVSTVRFLSGKSQCLSYTNIFCRG